MDSTYSRLAFTRALELLNLTIADPRRRLKEITRLREAAEQTIICEFVWSLSPPAT